MLKERSQSYFASLAFYDFCASLGAYVLAMLTRFVLQEGGLWRLLEIDRQLYYYFGILLAVVQVVVFVALGMYRLKNHTTVSDEASRVVLAVGVNVLAVVASLYVLRIEHVSRFVILYYALFDMAVISIRHPVSRRLVWLLRRRSDRRRSVIILGSGPAAERITAILRRNPMLAVEITGCITDGAAEPLTTVPHLGTLERLTEILEQHRPDMAVYTFTDQSSVHMAEILDLCDQIGINLKIVPSFADLVAARGDVETLEGVPVISIREIPARVGFNRFLKRLFDILFSFIIIVILSPLYILVALAIKVTSPGPIFYTQERVGLDNRPFNMLKFRTMRVQEKTASDTIWTTKNDPRVTPVGGIMRKLSIDELPQFFNVLVGSMSVVGPRPERPFFVDQFKDQYHHYMRRHAMKAGITGWAQINGLRGDTSIQERIEADIYYIENWSFWLDLKIILLTPFKGMINKNAY